jgi:hypothetical protein
MSLIKLNTDATTNQLRVFSAAVLPLFGLIVSAILYYRFQQTIAPLAIITTCAVAGCIGLVKPSLIRPLYVGWMYAAYPIGWLIGHILLAVVFFVVLTPIGLIMRLLGRDPLQREFETNKPTYWEPLEQPTDIGRYFRQF